MNNRTPQNILQKTPRIVSFGLLLSGLFIFARCATVYDIAPEGPRPTITSVTPDCGRYGEVVEIKGSNFSVVPSQNMVTINGIEVSILSVNDSVITAVIPQNSGSGTVRVESNNIASEGPPFHFIPTGKVNGFANGFYYSNGLAADSQGNVYVAESQRNRVLKITPSGEASVFAGDGTAGYWEGTGQNARFNLPFDVAVDSQDNVYVSDYGNSLIRKITPEGEVSLYAGYVFTDFDNPLPVNGYHDSTRTLSLFYLPAGIAFDADDNLYVVDQGNLRIRKVTPDAGNNLGVVTTLAGNGESGDDDGPAMEATFHYPTFLTLDDSGNLYLTDLAGVREISSDNNVSTLFSMQNAYEDCLGNTLIANGLSGIAFDPAGFIYLAALVNDTDYRILTLHPDNSMSVLAGGGEQGAGYEENETEGIEAAFGFVNGMTMVGDDLYALTNYYFTDFMNVRRIEIK